MPHPFGTNVHCTEPSVQTLQPVAGHPHTYFLHRYTFQEPRAYDTPLPASGTPLDTDPRTGGKKRKTAAATSPRQPRQQSLTAPATARGNRAGNRPGNRRKARPRPSEPLIRQTPADPSSGQSPKGQAPAATPNVERERGRRVPKKAAKKSAGQPLPAGRDAPKKSIKKSIKKSMEQRLQA